MSHSPVLPHQDGRDEEQSSSQEEGEALHEVQGGWVERVEDAGGHQHGQAIHTGQSRKESACEEIPHSNLKDLNANAGTTTQQLCDRGQATSPGSDLSHL